MDNVDIEISKDDDEEATIQKVNDHHGNNEVATQTADEKLLMRSVNPSSERQDHPEEILTIFCA